MHTLTEINAWQILRKELFNKTIGFIPTMGNLHEGHLSLCRRSQAENDITVVSIFVNPTQFNQTQDFNHYPRTLEHDQELLSKQDIDYLLLPDAEAMYSDDYHVRVIETELSQELEGSFRPGHVSGMLTIVLKLLNWVQPTRVYFGEKDYQQFLLVKKMAAGLLLPVEVVPCATVRAEDGLALSSRNARLTAEQRKKAAYFPKILQSDLTTDQMIDELSQQGFEVDYIVEKWGRRLGAVWLDDVRLIDNIPR